MKRRNLRLGLLLLAIPLAAWGIADGFDRRSNPVLVTMGPRGAVGPPVPTPAVPAAMAGVDGGDQDTEKKGGQHGPPPGKGKKQK